MADTLPPNEPPTPAGGSPAPTARSEADILADPALRAHLAAYHPVGVEPLLKEYARLTKELAEYGERYEQNMESWLHQYETWAYERLWDIQQKKLFNLQCEWRAGLEIPGVQLTAQFRDWAEYIEQCPVLSPISPEELALYDAFLAQLDDPSDLVSSSSVQYFWLFRKLDKLNDDDADDNEHELPAWFQYYDQYQGTTALLHLPDIRGEREQEYLKEAHLQRHARHEAETPAAPPDLRPMLPWQSEEREPLLRDLLRRFSDPRLLRYYESYRFLQETEDDQEEVEQAFEVLKDAAARVAIEAHANWRTALIQTANHYRLRQLRAALPRVYEDYCQRLELGIQHASPWKLYRRKQPGPTQYFDHDRELILEARARRGEPQNLDF